MNLTSEEIQRFFSDFNENYNPKDKVNVGIASAYPYLQLVKNLSNDLILTGSQNIHFENSGAFTGEVSPLMLKDFGTSFTIVGHSERRQYFGETSAVVSKRARAALNHNILPIICIGESRAEFEAGTTFKIIEEQLIESINNCLYEGQQIFPVIAYEPVWAIGTGLSATKEQVDTVHLFILDKLTSMLTNLNLNADSVSVIYGGSVNTKNCEELSNLESVDGFLIGGSSLKPVELNEIIKLSF